VDKYIGFKLIQAEPAWRTTCIEDGEIVLVPKSERPCKDSLSADTEDGYKVFYPDGYVSWSPKEVFEKAYMRVANDNTITNDIVDSFIERYEDYTIGEKTTVVRAVLRNNFVVVDSSSCVDPANFNQEIGISICKDKIKNKVWELLGFLLQTAKSGIK
jgi:hypothetical protein